MAGNTVNLHRVIKTSPEKIYRAILWMAVAACFILLIPLVAMQFTAAVQWSRMDFAAMSSLVFGAGSIFILVARKAPRKYWPAIGIVVAVALLYVWAELAVGIFTNLGS
jgi:MFS superfamily sulfate permease-like transporter